MSGPFGARLGAGLTERGSLCVGIDPHAALLAAWGLTDDADGLARFTDACVEGFAGTAAVVKPQSAFFERHGSAGVAVLEHTIVACRQAGALVVLDVKRGDIGSTMTAYAQAYLGPGAPLQADAITLSPYLGVGSLQPAFDLALACDAGVFVLALTSNAEGPQVQHARVSDGRPLAQVVLDDLATRNAAAAGRPPALSTDAALIGPFGAVVAATIGDADIALDGFGGPLLVPGIGAQGGTADDVRRIFADVLPAVLPSVSREVLRAGPDPGALRGAAEQLRDRFTFLRSTC